MHASMSTKVGRNSDKLRTSKLQFTIICVVLVLSTVTACIYAVRTEHNRVLFLSLREALNLREIFQHQLSLYEGVVNEVADVLHFNSDPRAARFSRNNYRLLSQEPLLYSLGWVRGPKNPEPQSLHSLHHNVAQNLSDLWNSSEWLLALQVSAEEKKAVASQPVLTEINGQAHYVSLYLVPIDNYAFLDKDAPLVGGFAFGVILIQQAFVDSIAANQEIPARVQLMEGLTAGGQHAVAVRFSQNSSLSHGHEVTRSFDWGGRTMELRLTPTEEFVAQSRSFVPWLMALLGLVLFGLMFRLFRVLEQMAGSQRTELRCREVEIERKQRESNALIDVAPVAILMLNGEGKIVGQSRNSITLRRDECLGKKFEEIATDGTFGTLDGEPVKVEDNPVLRALRGECIVNLQLVQQCEEGDTYYSFCASPIYDGEGGISGSVCVSSDVTDLVQSIESQKHINAQLESSNHRLRQFASVASHDLQEPLRKITSFASLLEEEIGAQLSEGPKQYLDFMVDGAKRMNALVRDVLQYSEITPGTEELTMVDLKVALETTRREISQIIEISGAKLEALSYLPIYTSARMLPRLLGNLVSNSIKYKSDHHPPVIEIEVMQQADGVLLKVSDNGMGIAEEYRVQVFNMFKRLHSNSSIAGTGIGLSICKQIVELNGGRIWIEKNPSGGSCFLMFFPSHRRDTASHS